MKYCTVKGKTNLSFGKAFDTLRELDAQEPNKYGMRLSIWKYDVVIRIQNPDDNSYMTAPYLYVQSRYGRVPWKETMIELFSDDWYVVKFDEKEIDEPEIIKELTNAKECLNEFKEKYGFKNAYLDNKPTTKTNLDKDGNQKVNKYDCSDKCLKRCLNECGKFSVKTKPRRSMHLVSVGEVTDDDLRKIIDEFFR